MAIRGDPRRVIHNRAVATSSAATDSSSKSGAVEGLSAFAAKILDQLAVTAWLPATMLVAATALLVQLHDAGNLDIPAAVERLATQPWGVLVILAFGLVLATMVTQAFSFEAIRLLEGYWGASGISSALLRWGIGRQVESWKEARKLADGLDLKAFQGAASELLKREERAHYDVWHDKVHKVPRAKWSQQDRAVVDEALSIDWRVHADPATVALWERAVARLDDFPQGPRTFLPTALGNVIRASEEQLQGSGKDLERFVMNRYESIPSRLATRHDQFRSRLDMYCTLTLVFSALAAEAVALLLGTADGWVSWIPPAGGALIFAALARVSYHAAAASGRGYGAVLLSVRDAAAEVVRPEA